MESDTSALVEPSGDDDLISLSDVSVDLQASLSLSFNAKKELTKLLEELKRFERNPVKGCSCFGRLWNICSTPMDNIHEKIGLVCGHNIPKCLVIMLENLKSDGYFSNNWFKADLWNASSRLFDCICLFSKYSEDFCQSLVDSGILCLLVDNFEQFHDTSLLKDTNSKPFNVLKATLCLVKNLARKLTERKSALRKCFWTYLQRIKRMDELGVYCTMGEVFMCGREELKRKTENNKTILSLIYWINQSFSELNQPTSWTVKFSLQDAIYTLRFLASFGIPNHFCTNVVLDSFRRIIAEGVTIQDKIQIVLIIWTLCFDLEFYKLIKRDKIVTTLKIKEQSETDTELLHYIKAVLTIIKRRYIPKSISFEGNAVDVDTYALVLFHNNDTERVRLLQTTLENKNVTMCLAVPDKENPKYFDEIVISIHKCHSVILCVSEFTELDYDSRIIVYIANKIGRDVITVFIQKGIRLNGWVVHELPEQHRFDFIESPFYVSEMVELLLKKSISFSRKAHGLRNTRSMGSLGGQSMCSVVSDDSCVSATSTDSVLASLEGIGRQNSSGQASGKSISRLSLPSAAGAGPSISSPISPSTVSSTSSTISFGSLNDSVPEKFSNMTKKDVSEWLKSLNIGIHIRNFRSIDGRKLWELFTTCQSSKSSEQNSYDKRIAHFKLDEEQKLCFTEALLKL